jgi:hypothetical protein
MYVLETMNDPKYAKLTDQQKADALGKAVNQAKEASNYTLGGEVARSPHESALYLYATKPHYYDMKGTPEQIARKNWEVDQARTRLSEYKKRYPNDGEARFERDDPKAYNLTLRYQPLDVEEIKALKARIDKQTGGQLTQKAQKAETGGLVGAGSRVLPASPPSR